MRFGSVVLIALVGTAVSTPARAYVMPYDPYPWCAVYGGRDGELRFSDHRTMSGDGQWHGGFCTPNQFYNPRPAARARKKQAN